MLPDSRNPIASDFDVTGREFQAPSAQISLALPAAQRKALLSQLTVRTAQFT